MNDEDPIVALVLHLLVLSVLAVGGINTIIPELHRVAVAGEGWLSEGEFATLFAIAQAAPGPKTIFVTLIGWQVAGLLGAALATLALGTPSFFLAYGLERARERWGALETFRTIQRGLVPVTIGLVAASAITVTAAAATGWESYAVTAASAAIMLTTRIHPFWVLLAAGAGGAAGIV